MKKFRDPKRNLPKPDYYIFVTNVTLRAVQTSVCKDKALGKLEEYPPVRIGDVENPRGGIRHVIPGKGFYRVLPFNNRSSFT